MAKKNINEKDYSNAQQLLNKRFIALDNTNVYFLYIFTYGIRFPNRSNKTMVLLFKALLECSSV